MSSLASCNTNRARVRATVTSTGAGLGRKNPAMTNPMTAATKRNEETSSALDVVAFPYEAEL